MNNDDVMFETIEKIINVKKWTKIQRRIYLLTFPISIPIQLSICLIIGYIGSCIAILQCLTNVYTFKFLKNIKELWNNNNFEKKIQFQDPRWRYTFDQDFTKKIP